MKKNSELIALILTAFCGLLATSCGGGGSSSGTSESSTSESQSSEASSHEETPTETAMKNFYKKIQNGNYTITSPRSVISVYSRDVLMVKYDPSIESAKDEGVISANNETFKLNIENQGQLFDYLVFLDQGPAIDVIGSLLPNYWFAGGNVWDYWEHTDGKSDFEYFSNNAAVKSAIAQYYVLGELEAMTVKDMHLTFDSVDVGSATITAVYIENSGTPKQKAVNITMDITFGNVDYDQRLVDWVNDPNRQYPKNIGETGNWGNDIDTLVSSQLLQRDFRTYAPIAPFVSYAVVCNANTYLVQDNFVRIHDYHATEQNVAEYGEFLENNEFYKVTIDGQDWYRKHMRTKSDNHIYQVFDDINVSYDGNGLTLILKATYNRQILHGFEPFNALIEAQEFPELDSTVALTSSEFINSPFEGQEDRIYFNNFDMAANATFTYEDKTAFEAYIGNYSQVLEEAGFVRGPDKDMVVYSKSTQLKCKKVIMAEIDDNTSTFYFTNENYVNPDQAVGDVNANFPALGISNDYLEYVQDHAINWYLTKGVLYDHYYYFDYKLDSPDDVVTTGNAYMQALTDAGFTLNKEESVSRRGSYDSPDKKLKAVVDWRDGDQRLLMWFGINA